MTSSKKIKDPWDWDPSNADERAGPSAAAGTYWGTGIKAPMAKIRRSSHAGSNPVSKKQLKEPPKSLA